MSRVRSCERCKYGPDLLRCQMDRTGKRVRRDLQIDWLRPSPGGNRLHNPEQMFCFEPKSMPTGERTPRAEELRGGEERSCERCKYGAIFSLCRMGRTGKPVPQDSEIDALERRATTNRLAYPEQMFCFEPKPSTGARMPGRGIEEIRRDVEEGRKAKKELLIATAVVVMAFIVACILFALIT